MQIPYFYNYNNVVNSVVQPSTVHIQGTAISNFYRRYLLQKAISIFEFKIPEYWSRDYFLYVLFCQGYLCLLNTDKYGVIPQMCGLQGYNVFYQPTTCLVTNPLLKGLLRPRIDVDCVLLKLQPDYGGVMDLVSFYGDMLALCAQTAGNNILNSKLSYVFTVNNKNAAESFKKMYDNMAKGDPIVVQDKSLLLDDGSPGWQAFEQNVKQNYISDQLLIDMNKWEQKFDTDIGIPNANTDKKERLITSEVESNNVATTTKAELWLEELKKTFKKANTMFPGIKLSVDFRNKPLLGGIANDRNIISNGDV